MKKIYNHIRAIFRLFWLLVHFTYGFILLGVHRLRSGPDWFYHDDGAETVRKWVWRGSRILGLNVHVRGSACRGASVLVSNHISWLDIVAIASTIPVTFVSKSDLQRWPIVGRLAQMSGTIFIKRGSLFAVHKTLGHLKEIIELGRTAVFFPEGTTTRGESVNRFNSGLFESVCIASCQLQPLAIRYFNQDLPDREFAPYVDDDHFIRHLWKLLVNGELNVTLDFLDAVEAKNHSRQQLAQYCQQRISGQIETAAKTNPNYLQQAPSSECVLVN